MFSIYNNIFIIYKYNYIDIDIQLYIYIHIHVDIRMLVHTVCFFQFPVHAKVKKKRKNPPIFPKRRVFARCEIFFFPQQKIRAFLKQTREKQKITFEGKFFQFL